MLVWCAHIAAQPEVQSLLPRPLQAEEYGQPQEAATWDFLSLIYVHQPATEGSLAEVLHARNLCFPPFIPRVVPPSCC